MVRRTAKGRPNRASDEADPAAPSRKQSVASDDQGHSRLPQLEASLARVIASVSDNSHSAVSNALGAYDRLVVKESRNIHVNQQKIEEAQHQIKKNQLNIEKAQKSLVDDIRAAVKSSNTDEVRAVTSPHDIHVAKRRAEVSPTIFLCQPFHYFSHSFFVSAILSSVSYFVSQTFLYVSHFSCDIHFLCVSHFII
jgi:hypothetical protein